MSFCSISFSQEKVDRDSLNIQEDPEYAIPEQKLVDISILTPPVGFEDSPAFNGYISYQNGAAIIISLITNANYLKIDEGMTEKFFRDNKLTFVSKKEIETAEGVSGLYYTLSFNLENTDFVRHIVYIGDLKNTLWLNITYPKSVEALMEKEIVKSITSVKFKKLSNDVK